MQNDQLSPAVEPWSDENFYEAEGVMNKKDTNHALAKRDYDIPCRKPSKNKIAVVGGFWLWWCSAHHQPLAWCEKEIALATQERELVKQVLEFLDELEMQQPQDLKTDNWRNWKYIRNSIVDRWGIETQPYTPSKLAQRRELGEREK